jgi:predicted permease
MYDLRFALRRLMKSPGFTAVAVLTLALGIGVNTAMFSLLNTLLLRALPYQEPDRLVRVFRTSPQSEAWPHSVANFLDHGEQNHVFERMAGFTWSSFNLALPGEPAERLHGVLAGADFFPALGVPPALGRVFTRDEDQPGRNQVAVLSHGFWQRRFASDTNIIGRTLRLDGESVTVIGVMPAKFEFPLLWGPVDAWRPLAFTAEQRQDRGNNWLNALARLKPGVELPQAQAEMTALAGRLAEAYPQSNAHNSLRLVPLRRSASSESDRRLSWLTLGLTGFVLLIACVNLANLQLARATLRARELAVRVALGAGRARLMGQLLLENLLVAGLGGALGLLLATWAGDFIGSRILIGDEAGLPVALDLRVTAFALACSVITGVLFGIAPAWLASRTDVNEVLKAGPRGATPGRSQHRFRHALIVGEVALALILLAGAGLFIRGLERFTRSDPGWRVDGLFTGQVALTSTKYATDAQRLAFFERLQEALTTLPGGEHASFSLSLPLWAFSTSRGIAVEGRPAAPAGQEPLVYAEAISSGYFDTMGIGLLEGRAFRATDTFDRTPVVIINESMARRFWPGASPVGKRIGRSDPADPGWQEIVGVVRDVQFPANMSPPDTRWQIYRPMAQEPRNFITIEVRAKGTSESIASGLRRIVSGLDSDLPVNALEPARQTLNRMLANFSLIGVLLGSFAALGLVLAAVGIYGVIACLVAQRTSEIGIRMALGAQMRDILCLVLGRGVRLTLMGTLVGLVGALGVARLLVAAVPEMPIRDPLAFVAVTVALLVVALFACWLPARRASRVDPMVALRAE